ncbi:hypothetical protein BDZ89DRAFT_1071089 [Hymenopellis radicata]|nr:hypothetical protein BDZ89DRAFT_1071089 [Hymenopellis radicata]
MPQFGEFSAWYQTSVDGRRVTCYIASEVGKEFKIFWSDAAVRTPTRGVASIDGHSYPPRYIESVRRNRATLASVRDSDTSTRPFVFDKINLTDDDDYLDTAPSQHLGEIEVVIHSVNYSRNQRKHYPPKRGQGSFRGGRQEIQTVYHERRKKGFDHQANLGASRHVPALASSSHGPPRPSFDKPTGEPLVTFCFRYRPLEILRAQEIIPRPVGAGGEVKREEAIDVDEWEEPEVPEIQYMGMRIYMTIKDEDEDGVSRPPPMMIDLSHDDDEEDVKDPTIVHRAQQVNVNEERYNQTVEVKQEGHASAYIEAEDERGGDEEEDDEEEQEEEEEREPALKLEPLPDDVRAQMEYHAYCLFRFFFSLLIVLQERIGDRPYASQTSRYLN